MLVAFVLYIDRFFDPIRDLSRRYDTLQSTMAGGERILALLDTEVEVRDAEDAREMEAIKGEVRFEHVSFHYSDSDLRTRKGRSCPPLRGVRPSFEDIDLDIQPGETVAFVGETGPGRRPSSNC